MAKRGRPSKKTKEFDNHFNAPAMDVDKITQAVVSAVADGMDRKIMGIDKSLRDDPMPMPVTTRETSRDHLPGFGAFRCYLGHMTYTAKKVEKIACLYCGSYAKPLTGTETCLCAHQLVRHNPHCSVCGVMDDGDGGPEPRCPKFEMSA